MAKKRKPTRRPVERPAPGWFDRAEMAAIMDVTASTFDKTYRILLPASAVKTVEGRPFFRARALIDALIERAKPTPDPVAAGDPLLSGSGEDSPALERYRSARADLANMDVRERR